MSYFIRCFIRLWRKMIEDSRRAIWTPGEGDCIQYLHNPRIGVWLSNEKRQATDDEILGKTIIVSVDGPANPGVVPSGYGWTLSLRLSNGMAAIDQYFRKDRVRILSLGHAKA